MLFIFCAESQEIDFNGVKFTPVHHKTFYSTQIHSMFYTMSHCILAS